MSLAHGAEDVPEMIRRIKVMEKLYIADGRHKPDHPLRGTYTGLVSQAPKEAA